MLLSPMIDMWPDDDLMILDEPSLMSTGIVPMSVFDKFDWDCTLLGNDPDSLLTEFSIRSDCTNDPLLQDKNNADYGASNSIFDDSIDTNYEFSDNKITKSNDKSIFDEDVKFEIKEEPLFVEELPPLPSLLSLPSSAETLPATVKVEPDEPKEAPQIEASATATAIIAAPKSVIRIPVKRSAGCLSTAMPGNGRPVRAVVVGPDRGKSIVCNVVRTGINRNILVQKASGNHSEIEKLPIRVNLIPSKDLTSFTFDKIKTKSDPLLASKYEANEPKVKSEYEEMRPETPQSLIGSDEELLSSFPSPGKNATKIADEFTENYMMKTCLMEDDGLCGDLYKCMPPAEVTGQIQPTIPDVFKYTPNSSPTSNCAPSDELNSFYSKLGSRNLSNGTNQSNHYLSKAAANVDHDYGFTCRTPKTTNVFSAESLGIQTPSSSEPSTDSDDDEMDQEDITLLNKDFESSEMDRVQQEFFENLKREMKLAEFSQKTREKQYVAKQKSTTTIASSAKERKLTGRNRKRKSNAGKERDSKTRVAWPKSTEPAPRYSTMVPSSVAASAGTITTSTGTLKVRLPARSTAAASSSSSSSSSTIASRRRKSGSGVRVFSPTERHLHNTNEQVRRIEMRQSFEELRRLVPTLYEKPRAPKVSILQEAKAYCDELFHTELKLQAQATALRCQQDRYLTELSRLRRQVAISLSRY